MPNNRPARLLQVVEGGTVNTVTITLPLPHRCLSPNARVHYMVKSKHTKAYRTLARDTTMFDGMGVTSLRGAWYWPSAKVQATFYFKDARRRDRDNMLASLKSAFDGIADAGLVANDADFTYLPVKIEKDAKRPRVELVITKGASDGLDG